ncbi:Hypothetical predicted protein, partial [Paramuricea clavata]
YGMYYINPQGFRVSPLFHVYCDMTSKNGVGVTVIGHNSGSRTLSKRCTYLGWWVSRQGSQMNYWGGAAVNSGKCACGMTNSCAGGWKCNCDKNDQTWREDSGYLTDKNTLPVTELRFGDAGDPSYEKGYYTLGKLRCW